MENANCYVITFTKYLRSKIYIYQLEYGKIPKHVKGIETIHPNISYELVNIFRKHPTIKLCLPESLSIMKLINMLESNDSVIVSMGWEIIKSNII